MVELGEERRQPIEAGARWHDQHRLLAIGHRSDGPPITIATQVGYDHGQGRASFQAAVLLPGRPPIVITESDIAIPPAGWQLRSSGLWVDHVCETPMSHWSYGLEAFALAIDDPVELLGRGFGERVPLGWELEFESTGPAEPAGAGAGGGYRQAGIVHGLVLLAEGEIEVRGPAERAHSQGPAPPGPTDPVQLRADPATGLESTVGAAPEQGAEPAAEVALPTPQGIWWVTPSADGVSARFSPGEGGRRSPSA